MRCAYKNMMRDLFEPRAWIFHQSVDLDTACRAVAVQAITSAAVRLGAHAKYRSAGTVEFLVDDDTGKFYFLEVLHPLEPPPDPK